MRSAQARYRVGEGTLLERATAESQAQEIRLLLTRNEADVMITQSQLQTLLNHPQPVTTDEEELTEQSLPPLLMDTSRLDQNPLWQYFRQQITSAQQFTRVEKARLLPDFSIGYFNQSLTGNQLLNGREQYFDGSKRFQGVQAGISVPLWARPQRARIRAATLTEQIAEARERHFRSALRQQWQQAMQEYNKHLNSLKYYEATALPTARLILDNARKSYRSGDIGYLEYSQSLNRALTIQMKYLETLHQVNQSVIYLQFLAGQS